MDCTVWMEKLCSWLMILFFANSLDFTNPARILGIFPEPARSHFIFNRQIMYSLLEAGHHITFVSPFQEPNPPINFTYIVPMRTKETASEDLARTDFKSLSAFQADRLWSQYHFSFWSDLMKSREIQNFLTSDIKVFDVIFVELLAAYECILPLAQKFKIPVIGTLSQRPWVQLSQVLSDPHPLAFLVPRLPLPRRMGFFQRFQNIYANLYFRVMIKYLWEPSLSIFYEEHFPDFYLQPDHHVSLLFSNTHPSLISTQLIPKVVEVAGIHLQPLKPLPQILEKFINESENGVILLSFGSVSKSNIVDAKLRNVFIETFRCLRQKVIWKFEENLKNISENVLISDWIPQRDILAHKNVKVFISHTGAHGMFEAIDAGVPLVSIPLFWDQYPNAGLIEDIGVGIRLDFKTLTKETLLKAINEILYLRRMQKLSAEFKSRPMPPKESVVYWTEYVLRHNGTKHLEPMSAEMPLYQYLLLDVIIFITFLLLTVSFIFKLLYKLSCKIMKSMMKYRKL